MRALAFLMVFGVSSVHTVPFDRVIDAFRTSSQLSRPVFDSELAAVCQSRAEELAAAGELTHVTGGKGPGLQAMEAGLPPGEYGEVLGSGPSEDAVWNAWLSSVSHRDVLTEPGWSTWGCGCARRGAVVVYVVRFWKP